MFAVFELSKQFETRLVFRVDLLLQLKNVLRSSLQVLLNFDFLTVLGGTLGNEPVDALLELFKS